MTPPALIEHFAELDDPRMTGKCRNFQLTSFGLQARLARERTAEREKAESAKDTQHRRELSAHSPPKGPLVDQLLAICQQLQNRRYGATSATPSGSE